jgi:hypothetical protein
VSSEFYGCAVGEAGMRAHLVEVLEAYVKQQYSPVVIAP